MEEGFCIPRTHVGVKAFGLVNGAMSSADASQQSIDGTPPHEGGPVGGDRNSLIGSHTADPHASEHES